MAEEKSEITDYFLGGINMSQNRLYVNRFDSVVIFSYEDGIYTDKDIQTILDTLKETFEDYKVIAMANAIVEVV